MFGITQLNAMIWPSRQPRNRLQRIGDEVTRLTGIGSDLSVRHPMLDFATRSLSSVAGLHVMAKGIAAGLRLAPVSFLGGLAAPATSIGLFLAVYSGSRVSIAAMRPREHVSMAASVVGTAAFSILMPGAAVGQHVAAVIAGASMVVAGHLLGST